MLKIRKVDSSEFQQLIELNIKSEAYWGFDSEYMEKLKAMYSVKKEFLANNPAFVLIEELDCAFIKGVKYQKRDTK